MLILPLCHNSCYIYIQISYTKCYVITIMGQMVVILYLDHNNSSVN